MKVFSFGDSWAFGSELNPNDQRYGDVLAKKYNAEHLNMGAPGASLGQLLYDFLKYATDYPFAKDDIVTFIIPPDIRWYNIGPRHGDGPVMCYTTFVGEDEWNDFAKGKDIGWFLYHHNLFIFSIIEVLKKHVDKFLLAHNYGKLEILPQFKNLISFEDVFLSKDSLANMLSFFDSDGYDNYDALMTQDGPGFFRGKYFEGNDTHPNALGHEKIAELFYERFENVK